MPSALDCPVLVPLRPCWDDEDPPWSENGFKFPPPPLGKVPFFSEGGVGNLGKCSVDEESVPWDFGELLLVILLTWVNLKRPFNFWPNCEAEVERDRVPVKKVGEFERDIEVVMVLWTLRTMSFS